MDNSNDTLPTAYQPEESFFTYPKGILDENLSRPIHNLLEFLREVETRTLRTAHELDLTCLDILEEQVMELSAELEARSHLKRSIKLLLQHEVKNL
jgi:regulator of PEP synthase PpsR (kinase-PPPase family)